VTGILDRLERAGFVKRVRDECDPRKVFVELIPGAGSAHLHGIYEEVGRK